jgi:hypothetical protein
MVVDTRTDTAYFSILRWRTDPARDEAKNVAVILVDEAGERGGIKAAPISSLSSRLRDQGLLDSMVEGLARQFSSEVKPTIRELNEMHRALDRSLYLTEPRSTAMPGNPNEVLTSLYRAYVAPRSRGGSTPTKGAVLDRVLNTFRRQGIEVHRGQYVSDFLFDAVVQSPRNQSSVVEVLSFATAARDWSGAEHDAGHFLYAMERVSLPGFAVIRPPAEASHESAHKAHERVQRWFADAQVPVTAPEGALTTLLELVPNR